MNNDETVWNWLSKKIDNPHGVAALMGNLFAESSMNPICANGIKKYGLTNIEYTTIVDSGKNDNFINDGIAYGLVQWCFKTRKQGLLELARKQNKSVGNLFLQLEYMWQELQSYKTVLRAITSSKNIREISDIVMLKYERPSNKSEAAKQKRAQYGQKYYDKFMSITLEDTTLMYISAELTQGHAKEMYNKLKEIFK